MKNTHCSECGTKYEQAEEYPRMCVNCGVARWVNPIPVGVLLQPVWEPKGWFGHRKGLAVGYRAIEPCVGKLALIGGYMDLHDESVEGAAWREFNEETSLMPMGHPKLWYSESNNRGNVLYFCTIDKPMSLEEWRQGIPCAETQSLDVLWEDEWLSRVYEIAFPLHKTAIAKWFRGID